MATQAPWPEDLDEDQRSYHTWYEPYDDGGDLETCLRFVLSRGLTTITNSGDPTLVPPILDAASRFEPIDEEEQAALVESARGNDTPVPRA